MGFAVCPSDRTFGRRVGRGFGARRYSLSEGGRQANGHRLRADVELLGEPTDRLFDIGIFPEQIDRDARLALIAKTEAAVKDRLTKEISYWDHRAEQLKLDEEAGKTGARLNSGEARRRADTLQLRLQKRFAELSRDGQILYSLNKPDDFILAIVEFRDDDLHRVRYVRRPFQSEPDFGAASVNYAMKGPAGQGGGAAVGTRLLSPRLTVDAKASR